MQPDYIFRIDKVLQFIDDNLDAPLNLETIADVAHYSPFHFHRIFKTITRESLNVYINRRRLEKAAAVLMYRPGVSITEISLQFGFTGNASFTRSFKKFYGISPTEFRKTLPDRFSKISQVESKNGQDTQRFEKYLCNINDLKTWMNMNAKVEITEMAEIKLACVTSIGVNGIEQAYNDLLKWAIPQGLLNAPDVKMITVYHDSFKITAPDKVRISAGIKVLQSITAQGKIHAETIAQGKHIVGRFEIPFSDFEKSWTALFIWMNEHGYKKADRKPFEIYHNNYQEHPEKKCLVDFCIPVA